VVDYTSHLALIIILLYRVSYHARRA